jgi:hypothetical protein
VARERIPARPTKRQHLSKSSPTPKHLATTSTSTQRLSDLLLKLVPIGIYMYLCSLQTIFKAGSPQQSDCREAGTAKPTTQVF